MVLGHTMCFLRQGDRLLLLNRLRPPAMGLWTGVGGKIEPGEGPLAGARREVREETGLLVGPAPCAGKITWGAGGMYCFVFPLPPGVASAAPRHVAEGLLDWRHLDWVLHPENAGVAPHVQRALPALLRGGPCLEHRFTFAPGAASTDWTILEYAVLRPPAGGRDADG